jgi:hypothetical protein
MCHRSKHRCIIETSIDKHTVQTIESSKRSGHRSSMVQAIGKTIGIINHIESTFHNSALKHLTEMEAHEPEPHHKTIQPPTSGRNPSSTPSMPKPPADAACPHRSPIRPLLHGWKWQNHMVRRLTSMADRAAGATISHTGCWTPGGACTSQTFGSAHDRPGGRA